MLVPFSKALFNYHVTKLRQNPATGIFLCAGWAAGVLLVFVLGQLVAANKASLEVFFGYMPWLLAVLIPALVMPVANEGRRGITERLVTLPHTPAQRLVSRFTVYWLLLGIWILGFWPLAATVCYLGKPDTGPMISGFIGSWLLAAPLLAVSLAICLRAQSSVGGFLVALCANLVLVLMGTDTVAAWFSAVPGLGWMPGGEGATLPGMFRQFVLGLPGMGQVLFFLGVCVAVMGFAMPARQERLKVAAVVIAGLVLMGLAFVPAVKTMQWDVTTEKVHTPSKAALEMLKDVPGGVVFTLHVSDNNPDVPPAVHEAVGRLERLLMALRAEMPGRVVVKRSNSDSSLAAAIGALQAGAAEQTLPTGTTYFAAVVAEVGGQKAVMARVDPAREALQEYDVMSLVAKASGVGGHGTPVATVMADEPDVEQAPWYAQLGKTFTVRALPLMVGEIPPETTVLFVPDAMKVPDSMVAAVKAYVGHGGSLVMFADGTDEQAGLVKLLPEWGVELVSGTVVADPSHGTLVTQNKSGEGAPVAMTYPYWLQLGSENMEDSLPFTAGIGKVMLPVSGELMVSGSTALTVTPVMVTSGDARAVPLETYKSVAPEVALGSLPEGGKVRDLALMVSGNFGEDSSRTGNVIVFADKDWLGADAVTQENDNVALFVNMMNYLGGNVRLTDIRAKGAKPRTLTRIEDLAQVLTLQTAATEEKIQARLAEVGSGGDAAAQEEAFTLRQQLRDMRQAVRKRLQELENGLLVLNLLLMPVLLGIFFLVQKRRQRLRATSTL